MSLIHAENISFKRNREWILEHVNLDLNPGELVGLIGPNGVGKTTLLKIMLGFLKPDRGCTYLDSKPVHDYLREERAKMLGYLAQEREVHWPLTVRRVVELGRYPYLQTWQKIAASDEKIIEQAMKDADVFHLQERPINELAGGEKALSLLARVLASEPKIILADEPVAGLDPNHQIQVMEVLKRYAENNRGVIVVLHDLALAARFCHKLCLIHDKKVLAAGTPEDVLTEEYLRQSYQVEVKRMREDGEFYVLPWRRL